MIQCLSSDLVSIHNTFQYGTYINNRSKGIISILVTSRTVPKRIYFYIDMKWYVYIMA